MAIHQPIGMTLPSLDGKLPLFSLFPGLLSIAQKPHMCGDFATNIEGVKHHLNDEEILRFYLAGKNFSSVSAEVGLVA